MAKKQYANLDVIERLISKCSDIGYTIHQLEDGCLGLGHLLLISPDDKHWNFEIWEEYLNEWSSTHRYKRFRKVSKRQAQAIKDMWERESEEI